MKFRNRLLAWVFTTVLGVIAAGQDAAASGDYVWARSAWGGSNINGHYSSMSNGYGGYYVPRNAYGNNYEAQGNFTNANGYIVPAQQAYTQPSAHGSHFRAHRHRRARH